MVEKASVCVAMSGGVDSSVAAALLVERGYDVFGIMLNLWSEPDTEKLNRCCTPDSVSLARRVASILAIPFYVLDARQVFYEKVISPFIDDYTHNLTPNPCIYCNRFIRWDFLLQHALAAGAEYLTTGHYAQLSQNDAGVASLHAAFSSKDQSYVLHVLKQDQLK
jgi:tRNA-specific 2-thiouridylase